MPDHGGKFREPVLGKDDLILITGAGGFIGSRVVRKLLERGFRNLRCLVRRPVIPESLKELAGRFGDAGLEMVHGDLAKEKDCRDAVEKAALVFHLAAGFGKSLEKIQLDSITATRNLLDAVVKENAIRRFLLVSSFSVYDTGRLRRGAVLDEDCEVYRRPERKGRPIAWGR